MKNKIFPLILVGMFLFSLISVSAISQETYNKMDFIDQLKYQFDSGNIFGLFTSWGEANDCSIDPDRERYIDAGDRVDCDDYCDFDKCAINIWYDEVLYTGGGKPPGYPSASYNDGEFDDSRLVWYKEEAGEGEYFRAPDTHQFWYYQIYCCPEESDVPDHSTRAYVCEDGDWDSKGRYDYDEYCSHDTSGVHLCWCNDEDENFYVDESGNVHCRDDPHSSWCTSCTSHTNSKCYNNDIYWYDSCGNPESVKTDCGSLGCATGASLCTTSHYGSACYNNDVYWYTSSGSREDKKEECGINGCLNGQCNAPPTTGNIHVQNGKSFTVFNQITSKGSAIIRVPLQNYGDATETINLEAGFYSQDYAQNIADLYSSIRLFSSAPTTNCNPNEEFVMTKSVTLTPGESETVDIIVDPRKAYITYEIGTHNLNSDPLIAFFGLYKTCLGGYINDAGTTGKGVMFDYQEYSKNCPLLSSVDIYCGSNKIGSCRTSTLTLTDSCNIPLTTEVVPLNEADTNQDGTIDRDELGAYIVKWINNQVSREALGGAIVIWANK